MATLSDGTLKDRLEIQDLIARFEMACTTHDTDAFRELWAADGRWEIGDPIPQTATGTDQVCDMLDRFWEGNDYFMQFTVQGPITLTGNEAHSQSLCQEFARGPGRFYRTNGIWTDRLVRQQDKWVFAERSYRYLWLDTSPFQGSIFPPR